MVSVCSKLDRSRLHTMELCAPPYSGQRHTLLYQQWLTAKPIPIYSSVYSDLNRAVVRARVCACVLDGYRSRPL